MGRRARSSLQLYESQVATPRRWLFAKPLLANGNDLNPVESVWGNLKSRKPANLSPDTSGEAATHGDAGLERIGDDTDLCSQLFR